MMESTTMSRKAVQAEEMLPQLKRHEIQVLLRAGHSQSDVAKRTGASPASVRRVKREEDVTVADDASTRRERQIGRPSKATPFAEHVRTWLTREPHLPTQELLRRAIDAGYAGHKSAFYALVAGVRPPRATPIVRFEGLPGEFSQHDFGHVDVTFVDGEKKRVHFFASRLKYSRFVCVTLVENEKTETIVRCLARDFVAFGGLPLMAVFDRPRTIVKKAGKGRDVDEFNATFAQAIIDIGVGVEMCAPRSGNQKGSVERLVGWVKSSFFKHRKFQDDADLRAQLVAWQLEVNTKTPSRATNVIPETRRQEELARLRPIKVFPEKLALRIPIFVGPTAEVVFEGATYSMRRKRRTSQARSSSTRIDFTSSRVASKLGIAEEAKTSLRSHSRSIAPPRSPPCTAPARSSTRSGSSFSISAATRSCCSPRSRIASRSSRAVASRSCTICSTGAATIPCAKRSAALCALASSTSLVCVARSRNWVPEGAARLRADP